MKFDNKREFAMSNKDSGFSDFLFRTYDGKYVKQCLDSLYIDKLIEMLEDRM